MDICCDIILRIYPCNTVTYIANNIVIVIGNIPLVNISFMSFKYRVRHCMVLLELLYFNVQHISKCDACQRTNNPIKKNLPPLNSVAVPDTPWRQVGLDLVGPLPETDYVYKYVATMTDYFSKWTEAKALKSKRASEVVDVVVDVVVDFVVDFVFDTISTFGCMETIITDQGREFVNSLNDKLCDLLDIKHKLTSPYHPQANGLDECFNQTLKRALEKLVNTKQNDWDVLLKHVLFAYIASENASTKHTPFYLIFG